ADGATVAGVVTIGATGSTDPNQSDAPAGIDFAIDDHAHSSATCDGTSKTCHGVDHWNTLGLSGQHVISVTMYTVNGDSATASITVTVKPGKGIQVQFPFGGVAGKAFQVEGRVGVSGTTKSLSGETVTIL